MAYNVIKKEKTQQIKPKINSIRKFPNMAILATGPTLGTAFAVQGQDSGGAQVKHQKILYSYSTWDTSFSKLVGWISGELEGKDFSTLKFVMCVNFQIAKDTNYLVIENPKNPIFIDDGSVKMELSASDQNTLNKGKSVRKGIYCVLPAGSSAFIFKE